MENSISKEMIEELPPGNFTGTVTVVENPGEVSGIVDRLIIQPYLGFDTETKPSFKKGESNQVSLLQLSTHEEAYLFRINKTGMHPALTALLENKAVLKIGVGIKDDIRALNKLTKIKYAGFVELQEMVKEFGIDVYSLKGLAALVLNVRVSKRQRLSNWETETLTQAQVEYAATDAWMALGIFDELIKLEPAHVVKKLQFNNFPYTTIRKHQ